MGGASVLAIDVLLEPDARMLEPAERNNARLRAAFPESFELDDQHRPHITLLQCFIAREDLQAFNAALDPVIHAANLAHMELQAVRYGYTPGPGMGIAGIWAAVTSPLLQLQADVIAAAKPFLLPTGPIEAFTEGHGNPAFDAALIDYVTNFVDKAAGPHFEPHVSTGIATTAYLQAMQAEPFEPFPFASASAAVYQLGPFGTAARLLHRWVVAA
jgi:hypothetical protein